MANQKVDSELLSLQVIRNSNYKFIVPSYQRPYIWPNEDVLKIFQDIKNTVDSNEPHYYIGTVLTSANVNEHETIFELIDGQQRTTTLVLLALAFHQKIPDCDLAKSVIKGKNTILSFDIREASEQLLCSLAGIRGFDMPSDEIIQNDPYLTGIYSTFKIFEEQLNKIEDLEKLKLLSQGIFEKVKWVNNTVPKNMDLNKLFANVNTSGIQLEQADLVKFKLLQKIKNVQEKVICDEIWQVCEYMDDYFERNVREVFKGVNWNTIEYKDLANFSDFSKLYKVSLDRTSSNQTSSTLPMTISDIDNQLENKKQTDIQEQLASEKPGLNDKNVESMMSFPLFLIHTYRIYLATKNKEDISEKLHVSRLIKIFDDLFKASENDIREFFDYLWRTRYQFDLWCSKWLENHTDSNKHLSLTKVYENKSDNTKYFNRNRWSDNSTTNLTQLQAVLRFTGEFSAQYWLTPFLAKLLKLKELENKNSVLLENITKNLEYIDNKLSMTTNDVTQKQASFMLAKESTPPQRSWLDIEDYLNESNGTRFKHYWFQKLEYVLWLELNKESSLEDKQLKSYRVTSKNSIEHVHPKNEEFKSVLKLDDLDSFGNLALLNPSQNSSYSNQNIHKKKIDFRSKPTYDSLKLRYLFKKLENVDQIEVQIKAHKEDMIALLKSHYNIIDIS